MKLKNYDVTYMESFKQTFCMFCAKKKKKTV